MGYEVSAIELSALSSPKEGYSPVVVLSEIRELGHSSLQQELEHISESFSQALVRVKGSDPSLQQYWIRDPDEFLRALERTADKIEMRSWEPLVRALSGERRGHWLLLARH